MSIIFSRHARRRMKLYNITESVIQYIVQEATTEGKQERIKKITDFKLPIKVVFDRQPQETVIITAYLLKKEKL